MKRAVSFLVILTMLIVPFSSFAANEVFVAINNIMLPLTNAMPIRSGGAWYVDYQVFSRGDLGINVSYNEDTGTAVLYSWDKNLVFNVSRGTAYNTADKIQHNQWSFYQHGTVYVPVSFVASQFGITYSYINEVSVIRLKTNTSVSDNMFVYIAKNRIPDLLDEYNLSKGGSGTSSNKPNNNNNNENNNKPSKPSTNEPTNPSNEQNKNDAQSIDEQTKRKTAYITIDIKNGTHTVDIINLLSQYNMVSTIFMSSHAMLKNDDNVRLVAASKNAIGIYANSSEEYEHANKLLYSMAHMKSRLLRADVPLETTHNDGYRQWGYHVNVAETTAAQTIKILDHRNATVIRFDDSSSSLSRMSKVLAHLHDENFVVYTINIIDMPVTQ